MLVVRIKAVRSEFPERDNDKGTLTRFNPGEYAEIFSDFGYTGFDETDGMPLEAENTGGDSRILIMDEGDERNFMISDSSGQENSASHPIQILLDPHNAFGDGRHPTTEICIHMLGGFLSGIPAEKRKNIRMLDAGTGSGILSILAAIMGLGTIDAVDLSRDAVRSAVSNARLNGCEFRITCEDIGNYKSAVKYGIIVANMVTDVIVAHMESLYRLLDDKGVLIASGISVMSRERACQSFITHGFIVNNFISWRGWTGFELRKRI